jgi:hypothetical protein
LRESTGRVNPRGLYDLDRNIRPVGRAYHDLICEWRDVLPTQSIVLALPTFPPSQHRNPLIGALQWQARERLNDPDGDLDVRVGQAETPQPDREEAGVGD